MHSGYSVVNKMCSADPKVSATTSQGIRGYIFVKASFIFSFLMEGMFVKNNYSIFNTRYVYFLRPLVYLTKKLPVPVL